jgi:hypothetical protein
MQIFANERRQASAKISVDLRPASHLHSAMAQRQSGAENLGSAFGFQGGCPGAPTLELPPFGQGVCQEF